ncbi:transposase, partial [Burkholderia stagnalis]|uniref:transposase n=1 Tax=Burkholderia stagnalis TaxID=1503054 RepID=UPI0021AB54FC
RRNLDCLSHSVHNSYRGHDRSFVPFDFHHGIRHRAFIDGTDLALTRSRAEAKVLIERWRQFYNERRPRSAHRYQPPATVRRAWLDSDNIDTRLTA